MLLPPKNLAANGYTDWIIPNPGLLTTTLALMLSFSSDASLTADVQYTYDDPLQNPRAITMTRVGTVLTIRDVAHMLIAGDAIALSNDLKNFANTWDTGTLGGTNYDVATVPDADHYTIAVPNAGAAAASGFVRSYRLLLHSTLHGIAGTPPTRIDGPLYWGIGAVRMKVTNWVAGIASLEVQQGKGY